MNEKELCVGKGEGCHLMVIVSMVPGAVVTAMTSNLFKAVGHLPLYLLNSVFSCLVLMNQFVLGFF